MSQQQLFPTLPEDIALNTPTVINGVTFTVSYKGHQVQWGHMRAKYQVAISRGAVSRTFDFFCQEVEQFPISQFVEILGFDQATLADDEIADLGRETVIALQVNELKIRRVFGTVDAFHEWSAEYLYSLHEG